MSSERIERIVSRVPHIRLADLWDAYVRGLLELSDVLSVGQLDLPQEGQVMVLVNGDDSIEVGRHAGSLVSTFARPPVGESEESEENE